MLGNDGLAGFRGVGRGTENGGNCGAPAERAVREAGNYRARVRRSAPSASADARGLEATGESTLAARR